MGIGKVLKKKELKLQGGMKYLGQLFSMVLMDYVRRKEVGDKAGEEADVNYLYFSFH